MDVIFWNKDIELNWNWIIQGFAGRRPIGHAISKHNNFNISILVSLLMCIYIIWIYTYYSQFSGLFVICTYFRFCIFTFILSMNVLFFVVLLKRNFTYFTYFTYFTTWSFVFLFRSTNWRSRPTSKTPRSENWRRVSLSHCRKTDLSSNQDPEDRHVTS